MYALTKGKVQKARELYYEICGTEIASIDGQSIYDHDYLYWSRTLTWDKKYY
jgi:hypothetical protein